MEVRLELSARQLDVLHGIFDDLSEADLARSLGISQHTVHTHMKRLYRKLGVGSRVETVLRCLAEVLSREADDQSA